MHEVGIGARSINFLVDTIIVFLLSYGLYKWYNFYVLYWGYKYYQFYIAFYFTLVLYYSISELLFARTIGKLFSLTKVTDAAGKRPAFYQVIIRSLVRLTLISPFFIPFLGRPLHDALSKTRVVEI